MILYRDSIAQIMWAYVLMSCICILDPSTAQSSEGRTTRTGPNPQKEAGLMTPIFKSVSHWLKISLFRFSDLFCLCSLSHIRGKRTFQVVLFFWFIAGVSRFFYPSRVALT